MKYLPINSAKPLPKATKHFSTFCLQKKIRFRNVENMDRKPGHLTKSVQEIAGSLFWIKVVLYFTGRGQQVSISKSSKHAFFTVLSSCVSYCIKLNSESLK